MTYRLSPSYAIGYNQAARYVLDHSQSPTVFFDGYNNGYFSYFMRALDPERSMYVLRGDKLLTSTAIGGYRWMEIHARIREDVQAIINGYGVEFVVVESEIDWFGVDIHDQLRDHLRSGSFDLVKEIPIGTNRHPFKGLSLEIYRHRNYRPATADYLELRLPVVGKTIRVPFREQVEARIADTAARPNP